MTTICSCDLGLHSIGASGTSSVHLAEDDGERNRFASISRLCHKVKRDYGDHVGSAGLSQSQENSSVSPSSSTASTARLLRVPSSTAALV